MKWSLDSLFFKSSFGLSLTLYELGMLVIVSIILLQPLTEDSYLLMLLLSCRESLESVVHQYRGAAVAGGNNTLRQHSGTARGEGVTTTLAPTGTKDSVTLYSPPDERP